MHFINFDDYNSVFLHVTAEWLLINPSQQFGCKAFNLSDTKHSLDFAGNDSLEVFALINIAASFFCHPGPWIDPCVPQTDLRSFRNCVSSQSSRVKCEQVSCYSADALYIFVVNLDFIGKSGRNLT